MKLLIITIAIGLTACVPRDHPARFDKVEVSTKNNQICFGKNEYKENTNIYQSIYISLYDESLPDKTNSLIANKVIPSSEVKDSDCFSPFSLSTFKSGVDYGVLMAYQQEGQTNWKFLGRFCIPDTEKRPLEVLQIVEDARYTYTCLQGKLEKIP